MSPSPLGDGELRSHCRPLEGDQPATGTNERGQVFRQDARVRNRSSRRGKKVLPTVSCQFLGSCVQNRRVRTTESACHLLQQLHLAPHAVDQNTSQVGAAKTPDRIIELAMLIVEEGKIIEEYDEFIDIEKR